MVTDDPRGAAVEPDGSAWLDVDYDADVFVAVPLAFPTPEWPTPRAWADEVTDDMVVDGQLPAADRDRLADVLENWGITRDGRDDGACYLHLPRVDQDPLPVYVQVHAVEHDDDRTLRELTSADDAHAVEPPVVEAVHVPSLGEGLRVLRYLQHRDQLACVVEYAWRTQGLDVGITSAHYDLGRLLGALDDIEALATTMTVVS